MRPQGRTLSFRQVVDCSGEQLFSLQYTSHVADALFQQRTGGNVLAMPDAFQVQLFDGPFDRLLGFRNRRANGQNRRKP